MGSSGNICDILRGCIAADCHRDDDVKSIWKRFDARETDEPDLKKNRVPSLSIASLVSAMCAYVCSVSFDDLLSYLFLGGT